jgi:DNA-3-methyladenine glycosylase II
MIETFTKQNFHVICNKLAQSDADLAGIIEKHAYPPMWTRPNEFETLIHFILEQQVSLASALAALNKLKEKIIRITPKGLLALSDEELRACYFSRQKTVYARGLALAVVEGRLDLKMLEILPDEEVRKKLIVLKGIGHWTIDVYLMFVLQRTDIFPMGDLAAVKALRRAKNLRDNVSQKRLLKEVDAWKPYRSVAAMMLWHLYLSEMDKRSA